MKAYLAAPLFSQRERTWNRSLAAAVMAVYPECAWTLPQDFRFGDDFNDPRHYGALRRRCLAEIGACDALVAVLDGPDADSGAAFEMGYACALGKPVVGVRTDYRPGADRGANLMLAGACRYLVREYAFREDVGQLAASLARRLRLLARNPGSRTPGGRPDPA